MSNRPDHETSLRPGVLLVSEVFPPTVGGSGRWFWELYRRLPDFSVTVLSASARGDLEFDAASPIRIERLGPFQSSWGLLSLPGTGEYLRAVKGVRRAMTQRWPAAIHCGKCLPEGLNALLARGGRRLPVWCFAHGEELTLAEGSRELRWLTKLVLRRAAHVIANSQHTRRLLMARWGVPLDRVSVLTPGVDTTRFRPGSPDPEFRARVGWTGRSVILTVGALQKRKGQDMLIRALPAIRLQCPDVLYVIAGEGWERDYLERLVAEHGVGDAVTFAGTPADDDVVRLYQQCDLFVLPNRQVGWDFEGFGIVLLEAQACGKPVITGTSGGTVETMIPDETGLAVPCDEPEALIRACVTLIQDDPRRTKMGARARRHAQRFSWASLVPKARDLFLHGA